MNNSDYRDIANILIVDDTPANIVSMEALLLPLGHNLVSVNSGEAALREVLEKDFAIIILDVLMPEMDGFETATLIKNRPKSQHIPIIFVTASDAEPGRGYAVGAVDYLSRPVNSNILRAKVSAFIELYNVRKKAENINAELEITRRELERRVIDVEQANAQLAQTMSALTSAREMMIKMEKLAALGQLSAGVAHEIKNPLNTLSTCIQLMQMRNGLSSEDKEMYRQMLEQVNRMVKIIDNLRDYARERKPEVKDIDIVDLLKKTVALVEYEMRGESINIEQRFCEPSLLVRGDRDQLAQVLLNFVTNARYSMGEKKKERSVERKERGNIWMGLLSISVEKEDGYATVKFSDNGVGIPKKVLGRIFDPFFTTKPEGRGTGLGLSISHGIIENHHGMIEVESEEGMGAVFTLRLPLG